MRRIGIPGVFTAQKPKFSDHKGATWDSIGIILPDGTMIDGHVDTTWGKNIYFYAWGRWNRVDARNAPDDWSPINLRRLLRYKSVSWREEALGRNR